MRVRLIAEIGESHLIQVCIRLLRGRATSRASRPDDKVDIRSGATNVDGLRPHEPVSKDTFPSPGAFESAGFQHSHRKSARSQAARLFDCKNAWRSRIAARFI